MHNNNSGHVQINGKTYQTVAYRMAQFRQKYPIDSGWTIEAQCLHNDEKTVIFKASIVNPEGKVVATGHAEETRNSSFINRTSAYENAETSATGRALAAAGFIGAHFASADEVVNAIQAQKNDVPQDKVTLSSVSAGSNKDVVGQGDVGNDVVLPDVNKQGWEKTLVPKCVLPRCERHRSIRWADFVFDTVKLQGKKRLLGGAQYLHILENWKYAPVQTPQFQAVICAALAMRKKVKAALVSSLAKVAS